MTALLASMVLCGDALRLYTYPMDPTENPDYHRYPVEHPGLSTFTHVPEFATLRELDAKNGDIINYKQQIELYCLNETTTLGRLIWPGDTTILFAKNYREVIDYVASQELYITSIHGFSPVGEGFRPPIEVLEYLSNILGPRWFGMAAGEQDGHYYDALVWEEVPLNVERSFQYLHFRDYFRGLEEILGPRMTTLLSSVYPHYELKSGHYTMAGAETSQHGPNAQLRYAFIRGAGKQYGVLWYGNVSIYNRWGHKIYIKSTTASANTKSPPPKPNTRNYTCSTNDSVLGDASGPLCGTSLNLMKRLLYAHILYGSGYVSIEREWFYTNATQQLSPIGLIQHNAYVWSQNIKNIGTHIATIALYLDFYSGWAAPRLKRGYEYHVWNNLPYSAGDHLTDGILRMLYPSYQDASYYHDETGVSSPTPYGDNVDILLSDAASWVLEQYDTILVASELIGSVEIESNLRAFLQAGGNVVITATNLASLSETTLGINVTNSPCKVVREGAKVMLNTGEVIIERYNMSVCELTFPTNTTVLAHLIDGTPLAVVMPLASGGSLTVFASPYAISLTQQGQPHSDVDYSLHSLYPLLDHVKYLVNATLYNATLFTSTANLTITVSHISGYDFHVLISNPELKEQPLKIMCVQADIMKIEEIQLDQSEMGHIGYLPDGYQGTQLGNSTATTIAGVDTRLFIITLTNSPSLNFLPHIKPKPPPKGLGLHLRNIHSSIRQEIHLFPTFFQHFSIIAIDSEYLLSHDVIFLQQESVWLTSQKLEVVIDATASINVFPGLRLTRDQFGLHNKTLALFASLLHKMNVIGSHNLTLSLHTFTNGSKQSQIDFNDTLHYIIAIATPLNITVHMLDARKNPFDLLPLTRALDSYSLSNMPIVLNLARLINYGNESKYDPIIRERSSMLYINAPAWDTLGIGYANNLPITCTNMTGRAQVINTLTHVCTMRLCPYTITTTTVQEYPLILDAVYQDRDELMKDVIFLETFLLNH